jgi:hypothetical protein
MVMADCKQQQAGYMESPSALVHIKECVVASLSLGYTIPVSCFELPVLGVPLVLVSTLVTGNAETDHGSAQDVNGGAVGAAYT